jgi:hypothetical protein
MIGSEGIRREGWRKGMALSHVHMRKGNRERGRKEWAGEGMKSDENGRKRHGSWRGGKREMGQREEERERTMGKKGSERKEWKWGK